MKKILIAICAILSIIGVIFALLYYRTDYTATPTLFSAVANHTLQTTTPTWSAIPSPEESGVYKTTQDGTDIYYYRGDVKDNNVFFNDMCWKIVRTTTTGGVKMIYNGLPTIDGSVIRCGTDVTTSQSGDFGEDSIVKLDGTNIKYAFDSTSPYSPDYRESTIKPLIDSWFTNNVDDSMLETTDFCINLDVSSTSDVATYYDSSARYYHASSTGVPTLDCSGTKKYPNRGYVGLLTLDEVWLAGGVKYNSSYYLYNNGNWWLLSPDLVDDDGFARVLGVYREIGAVSGRVDTVGGAIRPVVSIAPDIKYTGTGLYNDPYVPIK